MELQQIKLRFGIVGNTPALNFAIDTARKIAPTDLTVLITGESGTGKEIFSNIIHHLSIRKHNAFIAVNCGAIPEGTIDSELFGHEKGSFTGAHEARKGYFEVVNNGTIFLDEIGDLPLATQARLLRVLESGEYIRVGSSKVQKTDVRVVAATNISLLEAVKKGKFREDLYYRLNTVPIKLPSLRERKEDIHLLFRKFIADATEKYKIPSLQLDEEAQKLLTDYSWSGNIRQLKNISEQMAILEKNRNISSEILKKYLPIEQTSQLPMLFNDGLKDSEISEREILYRVLFDMKKDIYEMKKIILDLLKNNDIAGQSKDKKEQLIKQIYRDIKPVEENAEVSISMPQSGSDYNIEPPHEEVEESLSLEDREIEMIKKALRKHKGKRKYAAQELGISERTLYRKIIEYKIPDIK